MYQTDTGELPVHAPPGEPERRGRWWRGVSGAVAAGMAVLAVAVVGVQVLAWTTDVAGPGTAAVIGHPAVAVVLLLLQRLVDRRPPRAAAVAAVAVLLLSLATLWFFWWL
ncbi:hypothetical protein [Amycolatopsis suaedae]|uniref:Uncharacterized protein n=1 Tax=Amycolatopsis suaedae TaxID=2510978 RepID=A0A4V2ELT1_9PSEU|nr:hypothetical protein [Amycolatopsis suaedae]RZQ62645.1 hypothetical protein EWH70_16920 [Amycolatopsis suaedae]